MKQRKDKVKVLRFRNFPVQWRGYAFFVEQGHNDQLNLSIINHLDEIRKLMRKESIDFIYFPYLIHEIRDAAVYNFPQMTKGDFSQTASSDILLQLLEDKEDAKNLPPCIMQYDRSENGIDYVNAFPISIEKDADLMPLMERLLDKQLTSAKMFFSSILEISLEDYKPQLPADETFDEDIEMQMRQVYRQVKDLQLRGVSEWVLKQYLFPEKKLSRLVITEKYDIILPDYHDMPIKMEPLVKAVFILFLHHEEGIVFKCLSDYREELQAIYLDICTKQETPVHLSAEKIRQSIDALTNPLSNSINEKCARVRAAFVSLFDESLAKYYYIDGRRGKAKKILLDRNLLPQFGIKKKVRNFGSLQYFSYLCSCKSNSYEQY